LQIWCFCGIRTPRDLTLWKIIVFVPEGGKSNQTPVVILAKDGLMIGKRLRELRKERRWLQQEMAEKLCISVKHYSQLERNKAQPSMGLLRRIADLFEVKLPELYEKAPAEDSEQQLEAIGPGGLGAGKNQRRLFKDLAPQLAAATTTLALHLDQLDDVQVEQALRCGMELVSLAAVIHEDG
jgi:putative transcriptional regulator